MHYLKIVIVNAIIVIKGTRVNVYYLIR